MEQRGENSQQEHESLQGMVGQHNRSSIPVKVGSDYSFIELADTIQPSILHQVINFSKTSKKILFPLEPCFDFDHENKAWWDALTHDSAYLNTTAFIAHAYINLICGLRQVSKAMSEGATFHFVRTVQLLRERLSVGNEKELLSDSTIFIILTLAIYALMTNDGETARQHMKGLRRIVNLRGGITSFSKNQKLLMEVLRSDIGIALHCGARPFFFENPDYEQLAPYPSYFAFLPPGEMSPKERNSGLGKFLSKMDTTLAESWMFLKQFCSLMNFTAKMQQKLRQQTLLETTISVMYRLLSFSFKSDSVDETIRLSLLALSSHMFLRWQNIDLTYAHLPTQYKASLINLKLSDEFPPQIMLWLLMVGAISVFTEDDAWLRPWLLVNFELCEIGSWEDLKGTLEGLMWVDILHDGPGRKIYKRCKAEVKSQV
ncbi:hypothetical protein ABW19_dt0204869 [Dactylella cylindrospora]|nr:hypothetical protein ABW19_dt0204869 [Dactylella cylindrospora]